MRHGKKYNHLGRKAGHRKATLRNLSLALIEHKRINTTLAKAKALRIHIEPLVTKAKTDTTHNRRTVFSYLQNKSAIKELFGPIAAKVGDRPGGYVRVIKTGFRRSDGAEMAMIEFVDFNDIYSTDSGDKKSAGGRTRRRRRGNAAATTTPQVNNEEE
jgi:large subunit ribosomal protein L17